MIEAIKYDMSKAYTDLTDKCYELLRAGRGRRYVDTWVLSEITMFGPPKPDYLRDAETQETIPGLFGFWMGIPIIINPRGNYLFISCEYCGSKKFPTTGCCPDCGAW